ncbi:sensor histidine kinase [Streptomyces sp. NPDC101151]|uniref:sensor histidine kinase n=1 Tax=Streptomyces sp. NPDC101151 TaxID=3366115 RepID=UPI0037FBE8B6
MTPAAADGEFAPQGPPAPIPVPVLGRDVPGKEAPAPVPAPRRSRVRSWLGENPSPQSPPFSKYRWLRLFTYLFTGYAGLAVALGGGTELSESYGLTTSVAFLAAFLQAGAMVLALWRPLPALAVSLSAAVLTALLARPHLESVHSAGPNWPWTTPTLLPHMVVLLLLALRVRLGGALTALLVTTLATYVLQGPIGAQRYSSTGVMAVALFSVAVLIGSALRGRSEARSQLIQQTTITAEERARRTLLEERSRIARELHDVVAHHMSVISIQAQVAPHLVENPSEELKENLAGIRGNALEALTELRRVLGVLRSEFPDDPEAAEDPYRLAAPGAGPAPDAPQPNLARLDALIENTRAAGLDVSTALRGEPRGYPPGVELSAYRIVQEGLSNALRHAPGSTVRVEVDHLSDGIVLCVVNSRPRQPVQPSPGTGHGLLGMRERAAMLGGKVTAAPTLRGGFMVRAFLPKTGTPLPPRPEPPHLPRPEFIFPPLPDDPDHPESPTGEPTP